MHQCTVHELILHIHSTLSTLKECRVYTYISTALSSRSFLLRYRLWDKLPITLCYTYARFLSSDWTLFCPVPVLHKYNGVILYILYFLLSFFIMIIDC